MCASIAVTACGARLLLKARNRKKMELHRARIAMREKQKHDTFDDRCALGYLPWWAYGR